MSRNLKVGFWRSLQYAKYGGLVCGIVTLVALGVNAATTGWQQTTGNFLYDDSANWVGGVINNTFHSSLTLTGPLTVSLTHDYATTGDLSFDHHSAGRDISFGGAAVLTLGGDLHYLPQDAASATPALNFDPSLTLNLGGVSRVFEAGAGTVSSKISVLGSIVGTGSAGLNVTGVGSVTLGGINALPGGVTANSGRVIFTRNEAAGTQPLTVTGGGLAGFLGANMTGAGAFPNAVVINGSGYLYAASTAPAELSGPVTLNGTLWGSRVTLTGSVTIPSTGGQLGSNGSFVGGGGDLTVQGAISGPGRLTVAMELDANKTYLLSANSHQGGTTLTGGTLVFADKSAFGSGPLTISGGTLAASNTPMTGANAVTNPLVFNGVFAFASQVPVEYSGTVTLSSVVVTRNARYAGVPVVTSFTGEMKGGGVTWAGDGHVALSGLSTYVGPTTIANYVDLRASALPNVPGPFGNSNAVVSLDISYLPPGGISVPASVATLNLQPGVTMGHPITTAGGTLTSSGGTTSVTGNITMLQYLNVNVGSGGIMHFTGTTTQSGGFPGQYPLTFNGAGTAVIESTAALQSVPIVVKSGKLVYNSAFPFSQPHDVRVDAGEFGGTGFMPGPTTIGDSIGSADAILGPGDGIGTLRTAAVTLRSDAEFKFELNSTAGTYDLLRASGAVQLGSAVLSLMDLGHTALPLGLQFTLIENTSSSATAGMFQSLPDGSTVQVGANQFVLDYDATLNGDGVANDVVLKVVPEPASAALLAVGTLLAGLAPRARSRSRGGAFLR